MIDRYINSHEPVPLRPFSDAEGIQILIQIQIGGHMAVAGVNLHQNPILTSIAYPGGPNGAMIFVLKTVLGSLGGSSASKVYLWN